jgi:hypothetical protein
MSITARVEALLARAAGPSDDEESRTAAWIACRLIREHGLLRRAPEPARERFDDWPWSPSPASPRPEPRPRERVTHGPYRYRRDVARVSCEECGEEITMGDALEVMSGDHAHRFVHGDCVPKGERP